MIRPNFRTLLLEALREFGEKGYSNPADLHDWLIRLHAALEYELPTDEFTRRQLTKVLTQVFFRDLKGGLVKRVPGISRYTLDRIAPSLRAELDRRIFAGVDLIRLNRRKVTQQTLQRFSGWVTSVPKGGRPKPDIREAASNIGKSVAQVKYEARRVAIDQGHKLSAAIAHVAAGAQGAIAAIWHDRGEHDHSYDARPAHLKRSGTMFLVRGSWAMADGLVKKGGLSYTDEIEQPAELPGCSCFYEYVSTPHALPDELLTAKGRGFVKGIVA